jgi:alpha-L-rhamnosidase
MNKINISRGLVSAFLGVTFSGYAADAVVEKKNDTRPNIIFIFTDDQRWDALGYAGNDIIQTPEMDRLAREGTFFQHGISSTPICSASRASVFTGLYERTHKYTFQTGDLRKEYMENSYPTLLNEAGYYTGFFGKFGVNYASKDKLFDVIDDYDRNNRYTDYRGFYYKTIDNDTVHLTRYTGQQALDFIDTAPADQPFCLSLSFSAPHAHDGAPLQYFWTKESDHLYQERDMPCPELSEDRYFYQQPEPVRDGFNRTRWYWRFDTPEKYQHSVKGYYRMIFDIDLEIARIRERLNEKGLDENTVIILMGDNGYFLGERQLAGKWLMYDNSIRVPLIIYDPRVKESGDVTEMALNIDIPSTILDYAGIEIPEDWHGKSLVPLVSKNKGDWQRDTILIEHLWEFEHIPPSEGVRTNRWKYLRYVNDKSSEELYYLPEDPQEINNLAGDPKHLAALVSLRNKLDQMIREYADPFSGVPLGLTVEYIREPGNVNVNNLLPRYSWIVPEEAVFQNGYQILVASAKSDIENNTGSVWDSGRISGGESLNIEHAGNPLKPNSKYFWKVRIWDQDNRLSEYSDIQEFKTGSFTGYVSTGNSFQTEKITPEEFFRKPDGSYFADFGKAAFGTLELNYSPRKAEKITVRLGEKLLGGAIDREPGGSICYQEVELKVTPGTNSYKIRLAADERNTNHMAVALPDSFPVIMPFRYAEIEGASGSVTSGQVSQLAFFGYFDYGTSSFESNDTILNQVWDLCKYSMKATSFAGFYVDGERERIPYEGDAYINQLSHYGVDAEYAIGKQTIEWFMEKPTWPTEWQQHVALLFYEDYMYTGDTRLIARYYDQLKHKTLMALEVEDGFISTHSPNHNAGFMSDLGFADTTVRLRDITDWPPAQKDTGWKLATAEGERDGFVFMPVNTVVNSFYYKNMKIMAEFARILGKTEDESDFEYRAVRVKKAINDKLFSKESGYYVDGYGTDHGAIHSNMLPLAFGIVPEEYQESVVEHIKSRGMACSVYGAQFLLEGLYKAGAADYAMELMTATHDRSWWNMIAIGSTITLEAWDMKYKPNLDWNHAWGGAPANIIPRHTWGITPMVPGFEVVSIQPQLSHLRNTSITVPTIRGEIKASYEFVSNRHQKYMIELPANMGGEFFIDFSSDDVVILNGRKENLAFGSLRLSPGINEIDIRINTF